MMHRLPGPLNHKIADFLLIEKKELPFEESSKTYVKTDREESLATESLKSIANEVNQCNRDVCKDSYYDQFFKQDSKEGKELEFINTLKIGQMKDHDEPLIWSQFLEFFAYNFAFYFLFGPFSIIFAWRWPGMTLWKNLNFWSNNLRFYMDCILYFCNLANYVLYFVFEINRDGRSYIYGIEILSVAIFTLIKSINSAAKYGTLHPLKVLYYKHHLLTHKEKQYEDSLGDWLFQTDEIIHDEFHNSLLRQGVDMSIFYFSFLVEVNEETAEHLNDTILLLSRYHKKPWIAYAPEPLISFSNHCNFFGLSIFYEFIRNVPKKNCRRIILTFLLVSGIRGLLPFVARALEGGYPFGESPEEAAQLVLLFLANTYSYYTCLVTLVVFKHDLHQKEFLMKQCSYLLSPRKELEYRVKKILPTINIVCIANLKAWFVLRRLCLDYGRKHNLRAQFATSLMVIIALMEIVVVSLGLSKLYAFSAITVVICLCDSVNMLANLKEIFLFGAVINDHFRIHKNIMKENQNMVNDLLIFEKLFANPKFIHTNFLYKTAHNKLISMSNESGECSMSMKERLKLVKRTSQTIIDDMEFEEQNEPFKVLELAVTKQLINRILLGLASLSTWLLKSFIQERMKEKK